MTASSFHDERPVLLVRCAEQHNRVTRDIESLCPECGGASVNAYILPTELPSAVELLGDDDE